MTIGAGLHSGVRGAILGWIAAMLVLAGCSGGPTGTATPTATQPATAAPASATPAAGTRVVDYVATPPAGASPAEATCFAESGAAPGRGDAWRCSIGNSIADPCFALDDLRLVCRPNPATGDPGQLVQVSTRLAARANKTLTAWLIQLADGTTCTVATGATGGAEGKRLNYSCSNREWILGDPVAGGTWTAEFVTAALGPNGFVIQTRHTSPLQAVWH